MCAELVAQLPAIFRRSGAAEVAIPRQVFVDALLPVWVWASGSSKASSKARQSTRRDVWGTSVDDETWHAFGQAAIAVTTAAVATARSSPTWALQSAWYVASCVRCVRVPREFIACPIPMCSRRSRYGAGLLDGLVSCGWLPDAATTELSATNVSKAFCCSLQQKLFSYNG